MTNKNTCRVIIDQLHCWMTKTRTLQRSDSSPVPENCSFSSLLLSLNTGLWLVKTGHMNLFSGFSLANNYHLNCSHPSLTSSLHTKRHISSRALSSETGLSWVVNGELVRANVCGFMSCWTRYPDTEKCKDSFNLIQSLEHWNVYQNIKRQEMYSMLDILLEAVSI